MKPTSFPPLNSPNRRGSRVPTREVDDLDVEGLHPARSPRPTVDDDGVRAVELLSFESWMSGGGLRPYVT